MKKTYNSSSNFLNIQVLRRIHWAMLQASQSARIKRNDENKTGVRCGWSPWILIAVQLLSQLYFDLYIQVPLRTPMLLRETWIFPKWQDQTFVVNTFRLKPLHFPTIIRRVFPMPLSVKFSGNLTWRLDGLNLSETWINTSNLEVIDEVKSVPGSQHWCPLRATI